MSKAIEFSLRRNDEPRAVRPTVAALRMELQQQAAGVEALAEEWAGRDGAVTFKEFETELRRVVFSLARSVVMLFLALREERVMQDFPAPVEKEGRRKRTPSRRHAGRNRRRGYTKKKWRHKGDKSKNARMATLVVMYTLRREGGLLLGPLNRWHYAPFAPRRRAFEVARREADKRGFLCDSGKTVQNVTDGDHDLACYAVQYFPEAELTVDVMHVIEKLWTARESLYPEGSPELQKWVELQKERLYGGHVPELLAELRLRLAAIPKTGPGNKGKRERLGQALRYLEKREAKLNYHELLAQDLEIGSGIAEGAVKNIIAKRRAHGGMRRFKERTERSSSFAASTSTETGKPSATSSTTACKVVPSETAPAPDFNAAPQHHYQRSRRWPD